VNVTLVEVTGQYIAVVYDDVMPDYVTVGDAENYSSSITNVSFAATTTPPVHSYPEGRSTIHEPGRRELPTHSYVRPLSWLDTN